MWLEPPPTLDDEEEDCWLRLFGGCILWKKEDISGRNTLLLAPPELWARLLLLLPEDVGRTPKDCCPAKVGREARDPAAATASEGNLKEKLYAYIISFSY